MTESEKQEHLKAVERREWLNLWRIYERCVEIAERVWKEQTGGGERRTTGAS